MLRIAIVYLLNSYRKRDIEDLLDTMQFLQASEPAKFIYQNAPVLLIPRTGINDSKWRELLNLEPDENPEQIIQKCRTSFQMFGKQ
jgi:hypothetical protein